MPDPNPTRQEEPRDPNKVEKQTKPNLLPGITDEKNHQSDSQHIEKLPVVEEKAYHDGK